MHQVCHEMFIGKIKIRYFDKYDENELNLFPKLKERISRDAERIQKTCAKYAGSLNPWLPLKPNINVQYYYLERTKKLGWCVNAKVSHFSTL